MRFNVLDWSHYHETDDNGNKAYAVRIVGRTGKDDGDKTVYIRADGFTPSFYVQIPDNWTSLHANELIEAASDKLWARAKAGLVKWEIIKRHRFRGFTNKKLFNFIELTFTNMQSFRAWERILGKRMYIAGLAPKMQPPDRMYPLYESNIEPLLRLMHIRKLMACGWIEFNEKHATPITDSINNINYAVHWSKLCPVDGNSVSALTIGSYDIETTSGDGSFPQAHRVEDNITMIGYTESRYGEDECDYKYIAVLGTCDPIDGVEVESCATERDVLLAWKRKLQKRNPDIVVTYNGFGFDDEYIYKRAELCGITDFMHDIGRVRGHVSELKEKKLSSSALGDNVLLYLDMPGRVQIDLMKVIQREQKLDSYKMDSVVGHFFKEACTRLIGTAVSSTDKCQKRNGVRCNFQIDTKSTKGTRIGDFIAMSYHDGVSTNDFGDKFKIIDIEQSASGNTIWTTLTPEQVDELAEIQNFVADDGVVRTLKWHWSLAKDDMTPQQMFELCKQGPTERALLAKYCVQDCALGNRLMNKLQILNNNIGMANVCSVPLSYLFLRGQGIKGTSLVAKRCRDEKYLIPVLEKPPEKVGPDGKPIRDKTAGYEGATVLDPLEAVYLTPVAVLDYNSLYPNSMRAKNLSHETIVTDEKYMNLKETYYFYTTIKNADGTVQNVRSAQAYTMEQGIIPKILTGLLDARASTKKKMESETDEFVKKILDGLQNAFKITANSLYGLIGAPTSPIYFREIAAATTATGRDMLQCAKRVVNKHYPTAKVIYGDTDSIFVKFLILDKAGQPRTDITALRIAIKYGKHVADLINARIPSPQKIEFEKVLWPFALLARKKYCGVKWKNDTIGEPISMGIVLKRRDNALICKDVFGGVIHRILHERSREKAIAFLKKKLIQILNGKVPIKRFIISKTLRSNYKNPESIAHYQLALRMAKRDAGNQLRANDRVRYIFARIDKNGIEPPNAKTCDRVEDPDYAVKHNIKVDYVYYINRQLRQPICQFMALVMDNPDEIFDRVLEKEIHRRRGAKVIGINKFFGCSSSASATCKQSTTDDTDDFNPHVADSDSDDDSDESSDSDSDSDYDSDYDSDSD